jgi:hypothetical protein
MAYGFAQTLVSAQAPFKHALAAQSAFIVQGPPTFARFWHDVPSHRPRTHVDWASPHGSPGYRAFRHFASAQVNPDWQSLVAPHGIPGAAGVVQTLLWQCSPVMQSEVLVHAPPSVAGPAHVPYVDVTPKTEPTQ